MAEPNPKALVEQGSAAGGGADPMAAAQMLEQQGKLELALAAWVRLKKFGEAARVARALGRTEDGAQLYADAGMPYEAAVCYQQLGDSGKCLDNLVRVPHADVRYRKAATQAIKLAAELKALSFQLERFLLPFVRSGPQDDKELEAFYRLGMLYLVQGHPANAREALEKLVAKNPGYRDAQERLDALLRNARATPLIAARLLADDTAAGRGSSGPSLLDLEELPPLPADAALLLGEAPTPFEELSPLEEDGGEPDPVRRLSAELQLPAFEDAIAARSAPSQQQTPPPAPRTPPPVLQPAPARPSNPNLQPGRPSNPNLQPGRPSNPSLPPVRAAIAGARPSHPSKPSMPRAVRVDLFAVGNVLAGRYRLEEKIGQGGMAAVYRAADLELEEDVALKVFSLAEASDVAVARFKQELKLSRQLVHANIIRLYDIGLHEGHRYISMELLRGRSLKTRLQEAIGFVEALKLLEQACAGLQAAHDQGVVHRDVKPDNFFLTLDGTLKIMDFGIAKQQAAPGVTMVGSIAGTPAYMSPEQISNFSSVSHSTDLYALGIMAYEIFTGTVPFVNEALVPLLLMHVNEKPKPPRERNPGVPEALEQLILKLLEKDPANRYPSARETAAALAAIRAAYGG